MKESKSSGIKGDDAKMLHCSFFSERENDETYMQKLGIKFRRFVIRTLLSVLLLVMFALIVVLFLLHYSVESIEEKYNTKDECILPSEHKQEGNSNNFKYKML